MPGHFDYKGFRVYEGSDFWSIVNIDKEEYPVGQVIARVSKAMCRFRDDVKKYIDNTLM